MPDTPLQQLGALGQHLSLADLQQLYAISPQAQPSPRSVPLPNISVNSFGPGRPQVGANMRLPDSDVALQARYQRSNSLSPAEWSAMLRYSKQF